MNLIVTERNEFRVGSRDADERKCHFKPIFKPVFAIPYGLIFGKVVYLLPGPSWMAPVAAKGIDNAVTLYP